MPLHIFVSTGNESAVESLKQALSAVSGFQKFQLLFANLSKQLPN
jgi:hypothetical protein